MRGARSGLARLLDVLLPPACVACGSFLPPGSRESMQGAGDGPRRRIVCPGCAARLPRVPHPRCARCDAPLGTRVGRPEARHASAGCRECRDWPVALGAARAAARLAPPADDLVHALKYGGWPEAAGFMAEQMLPVLASAPIGADAPLVPVPTTPERARRRGYNQAEALARALAAPSGRCLVHALERRSGGGTQVALHREDRRENVRGAFAVSDGGAAELRGRSVVLVDDVLTTGATGSEAAQTLVGAGADGVLLLTFARALPGRSGRAGAADGAPDVPESLAFLTRRATRPLDRRPEDPGRGG